MGKSTNSLKVQADLKNLSDIREFVKDSAEVAGFSEGEIYEIRLAVDEACANIISHGYKGNDGDITVTVDHDNDSLTVSLRDSAPLYNPLEETPSPNLDIPLEERAIGGMGVLIVKQNTDCVKYQHSATGGNELILTKFRAGPSTLSL